MIIKSFAQNLVMYIIEMCVLAIGFIAPHQVQAGTIQPRLTLPFSEADSIDKKLFFYDQIAGVYPPTVSTKEELAKIQKDWHITEQELIAQLSISHNSIAIELRLGHLYRFGHNLDIEGTWEKSEAHFRKAIELSPALADAHIGLAMLYVTSDFEHAALAEPLFEKAIKFAKNDKTITEAIYGLFFSYYYQGKASDALALANKYIAQHPDDENMKHLKEIVQLAIKRAKDKRE